MLMMMQRLSTPGTIIKLPTVCMFMHGEHAVSSVGVTKPQVVRGSTTSLTDRAAKQSCCQKSTS